MVSDFRLMTLAKFGDDRVPDYCTVLLSCSWYEQNVYCTRINTVYEYVCRSEPVFPRPSSRENRWRAPYVKARSPSNAEQVRDSCPCDRRRDGVGSATSGVQSRFRRSRQCCRALGEHDIGTPQHGAETARSGAETMISSVGGGTCHLNVQGSASETPRMETECPGESEVLTAGGDGPLPRRRTMTPRSSR